MSLRLDDIDLPAGLHWFDEYTAHAVVQSVRRTLDGSLVVYYAALAAGRPITLASGEDHGWLRGSTVDALAVLAASPGAIYTLTLRGVARRVMFRHHERPAFEARPLWPLANPGPDDWYLATLKLMTV
ncbi:MAG: hypothetical protein H3C26_07325 [Rhodocyclaceae bacterium]|nr:hypothetical protein [Rhodocyclaceae bacterium]